MAKKVPKKALKGIVLFVILPLLLINCYAFSQLNSYANSIHVSLFGSLSDTLTQLAIVMAINSLVIIFLLIYISTNRK